jgi:hypothetical protein
METNQRTSDSKQQDAYHPETSWTIMLYIAADGTLANFAVESLKQLNRSAAKPLCQADQAKVRVAAQFAVDAPGGQQIPRYIFDANTTSGSISNGFAGYLDAPATMTEQQALISFLQWVYGLDCKTDHYALILWGHGPELLLQPPAANQINDPCDPQDDGDSLYLTPEDLRVALSEGLPKDEKLDIIAFDACSMSMFEMAYEIKEHVDYMVASQEEVPDPSFPYDTLVDLFRGEGANTEKLIRDGVCAYVSDYQDYICNAVTGMKKVMLSAFRLDRYEDLRSALHSLACALWDAQTLPSLPGLLVQARASSRDFVAGLYVDLDDFCTKLYRLLSVCVSDETLKYKSCSGKQGKEKHECWENNIRYACQSVIAALPYVPNSKSLVLANSTNDPDCHGISLYLPYLTNLQYAALVQPMVKGGPDTIGKGLSSVVNNAASNLLMCNRRDLIVVTESYYEDLQMALDTGWYRFIVQQWSKILAQTAPTQLDFLYSAQQCAENLSRQKVKRNDKYLCPEEPPHKPGCGCGG